MKLEWDFHEFNDFAKRLQDKHELETALMTATQNVARVLHKHLLLNTPIVTGNLRKMWSAGNNLYFEVKDLGDGYEVTFINAAQNNGFMYGVSVNDGHRTTSGGWVMGRFFVEKSIIQVGESQRLENLVYKELQKWWKGCF
jgi:hypothetical protein